MFIGSKYLTNTLPYTLGARFLYFLAKSVRVNSSSFLPFTISVVKFFRSKILSYEIITGTSTRFLLYDYCRLRYASIIHLTAISERVMRLNLPVRGLVEFWNTVVRLLC
jgi:hypothetical protein